MKRIIVLCASLCILILACGKKVVPAGSNGKGTESGETQKNKNQQAKPGDIADPNNQAPKEDRASSENKSNTSESPGTNPATLPTGPNAPNKPSYEEMGKHVYSSKCSKCHGSKNVKNYTFNQWEGILKTMIPNAKLTADEESYVIAYIKANAKN